MHTVVNQLTLKPRSRSRRRGAREGTLDPGDSPLGTGVTASAGTWRDGLLAREGDNPLGDLGPPIVELAVE